MTFAKHRIIRNGQSLQINCTVFGNDSGSNLVLKWNKVGSFSDITSRKTANNTLQLQIQSVEKSDEGEYQCVVTREGHIENSTSVHVMVGGEYHVFV